MFRPRRTGSAWHAWPAAPVVSGLLLVMVLATAIAVAAQGPGGTSVQPPTESADASNSHDAAVEDDPVGAELTRRLCQDQCHTTERITTTRRAAFEWAQVILDMEARGAQASPDEFDTIRRYLTRRYGFVNVNRASASELAAVLGLTMPIARAIIDYRRTNGPFEDLAGLAEVPGVDREVLETETDAVRFN